MDLKYLIWAVSCHVFNVHPTCWRVYEYWLAYLSVKGDGKVELLLNLDLTNYVNCIAWETLFT
jgi:hypothetical protein